LYFVQLNVPHSSDPLSEKTTSCIALQHRRVDQDGSMFFFSLKTKDVIKRNAWTVMPITDPVVHFINQKGRRHLSNSNWKPSVVQSYGGTFKYLQSVATAALDATPQTSTPEATAAPQDPTPLPSFSSTSSYPHSSSRSSSGSHRHRF
jgi:hypothetical protein